MKALNFPGTINISSGGNAPAIKFRKDNDIVFHTRNYNADVVFFQ